MKNKLWPVGIVVVLVALAAWWFVKEVKKRIPDMADRSVAYPELVREHIAAGTAHGDYNSNPPSSGWHYEATAKLGFYDVDEPPVPDENLIHNLEHGEIWIVYRPSIPLPVREALKKFAAESLVVITPRAANDADIALVAWGRVDKFNLASDAGLDESRITDFITRYRNRGPEKVAPSARISK